MQIGYMSVSKADGSQSTDLQRGRARGRRRRPASSLRGLCVRPGLDAALKPLRRHPYRQEARPVEM